MKSLDPHEVLKCLFTAERVFDRRGWDMPPTLWALHVEPNGEIIPGPHPVALARPEGDDAVRMVHRLTLALSLPLGNIARTSLMTTSWVGYMLASEVWTLKVDGPGEAERAAGKRQIHRHPDRVEARMLVAIDRTGGLHQIVRPRGGTPEVFEAEDEGRVPEALRGLLNATRSQEASMN